jgi:hypothetical protein
MLCFPYFLLRTTWLMIYLQTQQKVSEFEQAETFAISTLGGSHILYECMYSNEKPAVQVYDHASIN